MRIRSLALFLTLSALAGCAQSGDGLKTPLVSNGNTSKSEEPDPKLGQEFTLKAGREALLRSEGLKVVFDPAVDENRCPPKVQCAWQGNARIRLRLVKSPEGEKQIELNTAAGHNPEMFPATATYSGYSVRLIMLTPPPYEARLLVTKN